MVGLDPDIIPTRPQALEALYSLYERPDWDEGLTLTHASSGDIDTETPQTGSDLEHARSASNQFETGAPSSRSMSLQLGMSRLDSMNPPPQPQPLQDHMFADASSSANPFHAISHAQAHHQDTVNPGLGIGGLEGGGGMGGEALSDPNIPAPNVDLMFWDQMLDEQFYGNHQQHGGEGIYGFENFSGGEGEMERAREMEGNVDFQSSGRRGSRMEGNIDFQGGSGRV
jgi:hypothetical protein